MRSGNRLLLFAAVLPAVALSSSLVPHSLEDRLRASDRVSLVQVLDSQTLLQGGDPRRMRTETTVLVAEDIKGRGPQQLTVVQAGGRWGQWASHIPGDAVFARGETAVLFLKCPEPQRCGLVALGEGKLDVRDGRLTVNDLVAHTRSTVTLEQLIARLKKAVMK